MVEIWPFIAISIPTMVFLGMRHALDVDHITAIDNLVRLHNAIKKSRWVGTGFSAGHMISVLAEMIFITYIIGGITSTNNLAIWGGNRCNCTRYNRCNQYLFNEKMGQERFCNTCKQDFEQDWSFGTYRFCPSYRSGIWIRV